jgi:hypothetical protein
MKLEDTDLKVVHIDEDEPDFYIAFLLEKAKAGSFEPNAFMATLGMFDEDGKTDEEIEVGIIEIMHNAGVLEMFEKEEIDEMASQGIIEKNDLHASLYEVYITEQT